MELKVRGVRFRWTTCTDPELPIAEAEVSHEEMPSTRKLVVSKVRDLEGTTWAAQLILGDDDKINVHTVHASPLDSFNLREFMDAAMHRTVGSLEDAHNHRAAVQAEREADIEHLNSVLRSLQ